MAKIIKDAEPFERFSLPVAEARQFVADLGQTLQGRAHRRRAAQVRRPQLLPPGRVRRPLPRPAHPPRRQGRRVQAALDRRRLLEGRHRPQAAPARSTAPPSSTRRTSTPTSPRSRRPRSATTACSASSSSLFTISPLVGSGPDPLDAQGGDRPRRAGELHQGRAAQARLSAGLHPAHRQARAVPDQRPLSRITGTRSSRRCRCSTDAGRWQLLDGLENGRRSTTTRQKRPARQGGHPRADARAVDRRSTASTQADCSRLLRARHGRADRATSSRLA